MNLVYSNSAEKEILSLDRQLAQRIFKKVALLRNNPYGLDSQKLEADKGYRIRIGDYRVIYTIDKLKKLITIIKISHRREVYR